MEGRDWPDRRVRTPYPTSSFESISSALFSQGQNPVREEDHQVFETRSPDNAGSRASRPIRGRAARRAARAPAARGGSLRVLTWVWRGAVWPDRAATSLRWSSRLSSGWCGSWSLLYARVTVVAFGFAAGARNLAGGP